MKKLISFVLSGMALSSFASVVGGGSDIAAVSLQELEASTVNDALVTEGLSNTKRSLVINQVAAQFDVTPEEVKATIQELYNLDE